MPEIAERPPTVDEAVDWIKKMAHMPDYCRTCLSLWKRTMGRDAAIRVFDRSPESVRNWINSRRGKDVR